MNHPANPFPLPLPVVVYLRSKRLSTVAQIVADSTYPLLGHLGKAPIVAGDLSNLVDDGQASIDLGGRAPASWRIDGRFNENGADHPLDILGFVQGAKIVPFADAAGHKGGHLS